MPSLTETGTAYYADSRVIYRGDGGYTVTPNGRPTFQVIYREECGWCICLGDMYDADPYLGDIAADPNQSHAVVGYETADAAMYILIGDPWS